MIIIVNQDKNEYINVDNIVTFEIRDRTICAKAIGYMLLLGIYASKNEAKDVLEHVTSCILKNKTEGCYNKMIYMPSYKKEE